MKVKYLAHACFVITADSGVRVITDPYTVGEALTYGAIEEAAEVVVVSHDHGDHNNVAAVTGKPVVVKGGGLTKAKGIGFKGIPSYHDESRGGERGENTIFCFTVDGVRVCHLGDLGHDLSKEQVAEVGPVDLLLVPVGGFYTMDASVASAVWQKLSPRVTVPMHYKTAKCGYPIAGVDAFLKGKKKVRRLEGSELALNAARLPAGEIVVLRPALA
ncbi:MAG: MBL fold metallo-hydrolase [Chloroflexota bacterium]